MSDHYDVLPDRYVEILGDRIVAIAPTAPAGVTVFDTRGLIFPGLVDAHNHITYNMLDIIPFGQLFEHRDEWRATPLYADFGDQYDGIRDYGGTDAQLLRILKLAELRALCAGTTTMQSGYCDGDGYATFAKQGLGINNAERFPSRTVSKTFPLSESAAYWQARMNEYWDRFVIHLAEGVNAAARAEFTAWQSLAVLDARTTIIHGVALQGHDWDVLAAAGGHLVWSPRSNITLYGATADVPAAMAAGVNVALAPDWTESGSPDLLLEMKFAHAIDEQLWDGALTPRTLARMVTRDAADALGMADRIGQVAAGFQADLMVVRGSTSAPYDALLAADAPDVVLTVVSGRPMYGDRALMQQFTFLQDTEDILVGGVQKRLATSIDAYSIAGSDMTAADVLAGLEAAYAATTPQVCCFLGLEPTPCSGTAVAATAAPAGPAALCVEPNPFNPRTTVTFDLPRAQAIDLAIYDAAGRRLAVLARGVHAAGRHVLRWDGRDAGGRALASGVYWVQLESEGQRQVRKAVVIR